MLDRLRTRLATVNRAALTLAALASAGCPQLLEDGFSMIEVGSAGTGGVSGSEGDSQDSGTPPPPPPDASLGDASAAGASGAGGAGGGASGSGGSSGSAGSAGEDAGADADADAGGEPVPDAAPPTEAGPPPCVSSTELCDGIDNDCDDQIDQGTTCATGCRGLLILGRSYMYCGGPGLGSSTAETRCVAQGMHLVTIDSTEENAAIVAAVAPLDTQLSTVTEPQPSIWLAARDSVMEGTWRWGVSGPIFWLGTSTGSAQNGAFTNWATGKPNDTGVEDCGVLYLAEPTTEGEIGRWNDYTCAEAHAFLCERTP